MNFLPLLNNLTSYKKETLDIRISRLLLVFVNALMVMHVCNFFPHSLEKSLAPLTTGLQFQTRASMWTSRLSNYRKILRLVIFWIFPFEDSLFS
jgi:hypothetical protein